MSFVLDASVALAWCFPEEQAPETQAWLDRLGEEGGAAPQLWPLEVLNGLSVAVRRLRITAAQRDQLAEFLRQLPIRCDSETAACAWTETARLAQRHDLTTYDAAYLELALRLRLPLATADARLTAAAQAAGVAVAQSLPRSDGPA